MHLEQENSAHHGTPSDKVHISERCLNEGRPLKVVYIGAGISGIVAAIEFMKKVPELELVIYEKNPELGGTWYENRYPGCACDVPSHCYQLSFESWPRWSSFFARAPEILAYWKAVAEKYDVRRRIRFEHQCVGARWSETTSKWHTQIRNLKTNLVFEDSADVLMTGEGILNSWKWPEIPGLHSFQGQLLHSADWDPEFDPQDKSVAVIGAGSSGIQIVPSLLPKVKSMDHYVRGRTWISNQHGGEAFQKRTGGKGGNYDYTEEEKATWEKDREAYLAYRRALETKIQTRFGITHRGSPQQAEALKRFTADMKQRLQDRPEIIEHLLPNFPPVCKRLTPGPGYLEALCSPKVNVIPTRIAHVDAAGVVTADGAHHPVDAIVCATGFQTTHGAWGFPIYGRGGVNLRERHLARPETYLGLATYDFPNFFQSLGPNMFQGAGNLLIMIEYTHVYVAQILAKMAYGNVATVEPKRRAVAQFTGYCEKYFQRTVYTEDCNSWYKSSPPGVTREAQKQARVTALWPGSSCHAIRTLSSVRWEDFEMQPADGNDFGWFGNGWTVDERNPPENDDEVLTWYLSDTKLFRRLEDEGTDTNGIEEAAAKQTNGVNGHVSS